MKNPIFIWILLSLVVFRISRLIATDTLTTPFRQAVERRFGSSWAELINCMWCVSAYITIGTYLVADYYLSIPLITLQAISSWTVAGYLSIWDD